MIDIATISKEDMARWQRIFKHDRTHRTYELFLGNLRQAKGSTQLAVNLLLERLVKISRGDAEICERMMRQTRLDQSGWDKQWANTTWIEKRVQDAISRWRVRK